MNHDDELLSAPCKWCGYNGSEYWQTKTHSDECPWYGVGGKADRLHVLPEVLFKPTNKQG